MSRTRLDLHAKLKSVLPEGFNVYYQPPSRMSYPCLIYDRTDIESNYADNLKYKKMTKYTIMVIGTEPDNENIIDPILALPYTSFDRRYKTNENLYHDVIIIYW